MSKPIDANKFAKWLETAIDLERETGDMYGNANGMEEVLRYLTWRNAKWDRAEAADGPDLTVRHQKPVPLLEGSYDAAEGLGDAVSAVVRTFVDAWSEGAENLRITVEREV